jgi:hypothetical protein
MKDRNSRHRPNTIDRVPLTPTHGMEVVHIVDNPTDRVLVGPTSLAWRNHNGDTVLTGPLPDRAALYGVLAQIEALGLELLEVRRLPPA